MKLPSAVADVIRTVAPTLAAALAGPFAPLAAGIVTAALRQWLPIEIPINQKAAPVEIVQAVQDHSSDQKLLFDLRKAELDLLRYEQEIGFRFADLEVRDRESARASARDSGIAIPQFIAGMSLVGIALLMLFGIVLGCVLAITGRLSLDPAQAQIAIAAFGLIGTVVGVFQGVAVQVIGFYFGSSASSKDKSDQITGALQDMGQALVDAPKALPSPAPAPPVVVLPPAPLPPPTPQVPEGEWQQGPFGGARWRMTDLGVLVEGHEKPMRTVGQPATVRKIWNQFGAMIAKSCAANSVPLEIAVACIAVESGGRPAARLVESDNRQSVGLMQTLIGTASEVMGRQVTASELIDPAFSIEAGCRYLAKMRTKSLYQPPLAAACHNAGGLYPARDSDRNRWNLQSTNDHIDRFVQFFNDSVVVAKEQNWSHTEAEKLAA